MKEIIQSSEGPFSARDTYYNKSLLRVVKFNDSPVMVANTINKFALLEGINIYVLSDSTFVLVFDQEPIRNFPNPIFFCTITQSTQPKDLTGN